LFAEKFDDENCLSVRLDADGNICDCLELRSLDEFRLLQKNSKTIVVLSAEHVAIHAVTAPLLQENKARSVIAYALEEKLAETVTHLHFAFAKSHYFSGQYLVVVIEKHLIYDIQNRLEKLQIAYNDITCDWFALNLGEAAVIANRYMVNQVGFRGALDLDLFPLYLKSQTDFSHILIFNDTPVLTNSERFTKLDFAAHAWLALKLFKHKYINFCQAEFVHNTDNQLTRKYFKIAGALGATWLLSLLFLNVFALVLLNNQLSTYDKKIALLYRKFFPNAQQIISPRFRINQILEKNQSGYNGVFWQLLAKFSIVLKKIDNVAGNVHVEQISMQNNKLEISLACKNFDILDKMETSLKNQHLTLHKSGVITKGDKIAATLEIS
jgi:general secretion pathway protein L